MPKGTGGNHMFGRPSLALEMHKQNEKENSAQNIYTFKINFKKKLHIHIFLRVLNHFVTHKMPKLVLVGIKLTAQAFHGKNASIRVNISASKRQN